MALNPAASCVSGSPFLRLSSSISCSVTFLLYKACLVFVHFTFVTSSCWILVCGDIRRVSEEIWTILLHIVWRFHVHNTLRKMSRNTLMSMRWNNTRTTQQAAEAARKIRFAIRPRGRKSGIRHRRTWPIKNYDI